MEHPKQHREKRSIELRSEKVRNIVGQIPSLLIRQGILIIGLVLLILLGISAFIPYKKTFSVEVTLYRVPQIEKIKAPVKGIFLLDSLLSQKVTTHQLIGRILNQEELVPIYASGSGKLISNVQDNDSVKNDQLLFVLIPENIKKTYGICTVEASWTATLKKGQKVGLTDDLGQSFNGKITQIFPLSNATEKIAIRIEIKDEVSPTATTLKGEVVLEEKSLLVYFFSNL